MSEKPLPVPTTVTAPYWDGVRAGKLLLPTCGACATTWFPPSPNCPACLSPDVKWVPSRGRGVVWSWNVFHQAYFKGFRDDVPYVTALIKLDEGPLITSTVVGIEPDGLRCDLPVEVAFAQIAEEFALPVFRARS